MNAIGGENVTTTVEGRERYPVNVRYMPRLPQRHRRARARRSSPPPADDGRCRWRSSRTSRSTTGPSMIRNENGLLAGYVYVDVAGRDVGGYVEDAKRRAATNACSSRPATRLPGAASTRTMLRVRERLKVVVPLTLAADRRPALPEHPIGGRRRRIVLLAVPFSAVGAFWLLYLARLQHERRRLGRPDRAARRRRGDRRLHAPLPRPGLRRKRSARGGCATSRSCARRSSTAPCRRLRPKFMTVATMFDRAAADHVVDRRPAPT